MEDGWNAKTCLSREWGNLDQNLTEEGIVAQPCPPIWDGFSCWGPAPAGTTASARCPSFKGSDITKSAFRICSLSGEWLDRDGIPSPTGWTNYTPCLTPEIREIMRRLGSNDDAQTKFNIAANTRILEFVGLSLSLAALLLSLLIFYYFRTLRNSRTRLHRHLFIAMVIQVGIRLIVYTDQAITRSFESDESTNGSASASSYHSRGAGDVGSGDNPASHRQGIDNTPILCEASYISLEYARTAMFMWMFVEGLFLHNMITVTVFEEKLSPLVYPIIGWIIPIPLTVAWAIVTHFHYGTATCWWGYNFTLYFWILEGPRLAVLMVNLAFLLNILRVLVMKLRQSNSSETQQAMKAVKAALVLLPLLGLTNLLNMLDAPLEKSPLQFALWSYSTHLLTSTQGFILAFLYCFRNGEVQMAVRKFVRIRILGNSKHIILAKKPIPLSALDNGSLFNPIDESQGASCSQTVNMINPTTAHESPAMINTNRSENVVRTTENGIGVSRNNYSIHQSNYNNNNNRRSNNGKRKNYKNIFSSSKSAFSSPIGSVSGYGSGPPPPLIVRSFSNGILKQTSIRTDRGDSHQQHHQNQHRQQLQQQLRRPHHHNKHRNQHTHHRNSENQRLLQRNSSCCSDDHKGNPHLFQQPENTLEDPTTITTIVSASLQLPQEPIPIITPMTSSSSWSSSSSSPSRENKEAHLSAPTTLEFEPQQHYQYQENFNNKRNKVANNSLRMLIIPEQLLKRKDQTAEDGDQVPKSPQQQVTVQLSSSASPPGRMMRRSKQRKDTLREAVSTGVIDHENENWNEEHVSEEGEQTVTPSSVGGSVEDAAPDFLSIDMSDEGEPEVDHVEVVMDNNKLRNVNTSLPTQDIIGINNNGRSKIIADGVNDDDDGDERTVRIALEILKI